MLNSEVLVNSARVRDFIAEGAAQPELEVAIAEGDYYGMRTFDQDLIGKVRSGTVTMATAMAYATNAHDFKLRLESSAVPSDGATATDAAAHRLS